MKNFSLLQATYLATKTQLATLKIFGKRKSQVPISKPNATIEFKRDHEISQMPKHCQFIKIHLKQFAVIQPKICKVVSQTKQIVTQYSKITSLFSFEWKTHDVLYLWLVINALVGWVWWQWRDLFYWNKQKKSLTVLSRLHQNVFLWITWEIVGLNGFWMRQLGICCWSGAFFVTILMQSVTL